MTTDKEMGDFLPGAENSVPFFNHGVGDFVTSDTKIMSKQRKTVCLPGKKA